MEKLIVQDFLDSIKVPNFQGFKKGTVVKLLDRLYMVVSNEVSGNMDQGYTLTPIKKLPYSDLEVHTSDGIHLSNKKFIEDFKSYLESMGIKLELDDNLTYWRLVY